MIYVSKIECRFLVNTVTFARHCIHQDLKYWLYVISTSSMCSLRLLKYIKFWNNKYDEINWFKFATKTQVSMSVYMYLSGHYIVCMESNGDMIHENDRFDLSWCYHCRLEINCIWSLWKKYLTTIIYRK